MIQARGLTWVLMSNLFWLTDVQMERLRPFFPKSHGVPRVDDRRGGVDFGKTQEVDTARFW